MSEPNVHRTCTPSTFFPSDCFLSLGAVTYVRHISFYVLLFALPPYSFSFSAPATPSIDTETQDKGVSQ